MKRREFIGLVCVGSVVTTGLHACSDQANQTAQSAPPSGTSTQTDGFESVGTTANLQEQGYVLNKNFSGGKVLVIQDPTNPQQVKAFNPTCTHAGCTVSWENQEKAFVCPCHDAKFSSDGKVIEGPAKEPLAIFEAKVEGDQILVKKS